VPVDNKPNGFSGLTGFSTFQPTPSKLSAVLRVYLAAAESLTRFVIQLLSMTFSAFEIVTALAAVAMVVLNLSLARGIEALKVTFEKDLASIQIQVANLRAELGKEQANLHLQIINTMASGFLPRKEAEAMHEANTQRLEGLHNQIQALATRVGDIG